MRRRIHDDEGGSRWRRWLLSGTKCWITNGGISDLYTVFARTSPDRQRGITAFLVEAEWGVQIAKLEHKLGIRSSPTAQITFDDMRVPDSMRTRSSTRFVPTYC